jgi:hypothetical protein
MTRGLSQARIALLFLYAVGCAFLVGCGTSGSTTGSGTPTTASIAVSPASPSIAANATQQFTATAKDSSGNTIAGVTFTWASSSTSVATINGSGLATAVTVGTTQITASASGVTSSPDTLMVTAPVVATITVSPASPSIAANATQQFTATAKDSGGNTITGVTFTWASSRTSVATISASGLATPVTVGTTQITASAGGVTSSPDVLSVTAVPTFVSGTASLGAPVAGAIVTLEDKAGNTVITTTDANGKYSLPTAGLTPPFMIRVVTATASGSFPAGTTLYSVSADALVSTTINTHVLTDLILRSYFSAQGVDPDTAFGNPVANPAPTPFAVQTLAGPVIQAFQLWFNDNNVNVVAGTPSPTQFNMITSNLTANDSGFDRVLHQTTETVSSGQVTQLQTTDGTTTQTAALSYNATAEAFTISSTTTNGTATTSNSVSGVASTPAQQSAQMAITILLNNLAGVVNSKGSALGVADVTPYLATDFLDGGLNQSLYASAFVNAILGVTPVTFNVTSFQAINLTNGTARTTLAVTATAGGVTQTSTMPYFFELSGSSWLIRGDQQIITISNNGSLVLTINSQGNVPSGSVGVKTVVEAAFQAPEIPLGTATVTSGTVSGGTNATPPAVGNNIFNTIAVPAQSKEVDNGITNDGWSIDSSPLLAALPSATPFRFNVTCTGAANLAACQPSGGVVVYTFPVNGYTTESISITTPSAGLLSSVVGKPLTVTSTLPTILSAIAQINLEAFIYDGAVGNTTTTSCDIVGTVTSAAGAAPSGQITIPATVTCESGAKPIAAVALRMQVIGSNGETTQAMLWF